LADALKVTTAVANVNPGFINIGDEGCGIGRRPESEHIGEAGSVALTEALKVNTAVRVFD
jgi:hypothetical protein